MPLSPRDWKRLKGVHPALIAVVDEASLAGIDFMVTEGIRSIERQTWLFENGKSRTMNSRHLTGHAVDLAVIETTPEGPVARWDWPTYKLLASVMKNCADKFKTKITWGGDWPTLRDGPHFELDRVAYPDGIDAPWESDGVI